MRPIQLLLYVVLCFIVQVREGEAQPLVEERLVISNVAIREGVHSDVVVTSYSRAATTCRCSAVAVPGLLHSVASWRPLAESLLSGRERKLCRVYAIDLPGQGESSLPKGIRYGELSLDDLVSVLRAVLIALSSQDRSISTMLAHSQGALLVQLLQQALINQGESLRESFNVRHVIFLAPVSGDPIPWYFPTTPRFLELLSQSMASSDERGAHISVGAELWRTLFFSSIEGTLTPRAPALDEVAKFIVQAPLRSTLETFGFHPYGRPQIQEGIFSKQYKTSLTLLAFAQDPFIGLGETTQLYLHLTGDSRQRRFGILEGEDTVHDYHLIDPTSVAAAIRQMR